MKIIFLIIYMFAGIFFATSTELITLYPNLLYQEGLSGEEYSVSCNAPDALHIQWLNPANITISSILGRAPYVQGNTTSVMLRFHSLHVNHTGMYTCVAQINGVEFSKSFKLFVVELVTFADTPSKYYASIGTNQTLQCAAKSTPEPRIKWTFEGKPIEGNKYETLSNGLLIKNVTRNTFGWYKCFASISTNDNYFISFNDIELKEAKPPKIETPHGTSIYGILNTTVTLTCNVNATPPVTFRWIRNNKDITQLKRNYNVTITNTNTESLLKFNFTRQYDLGEYTCKAGNPLNTTTKTFTLKELAVPTVYVTDIKNDSLRVTIKHTKAYPESLLYKIIYQQSNATDNSSVIETTYKSERESHVMYGFQSNTVYHFRVGACVSDFLCAYSNTIEIATAPSVPLTSSSVTIYKFIIRVVFLLPAFLIYHQRRLRDL